ncbi:hypothetical protein MRX96_038901 [Rhipicephalus microplus]
MASCILASGRGCLPDIALRFLNAVALVRVFYVVPLIAPRPVQWDALDTLHLGVVRRLYGLPRSAGRTRSATTLADRPHPGGGWRDVPFTQCVAPHPSHVPHPRGTTPGWTTPRSSSLEHGPARIGDPGLEITTTVPSIRSKRNTPQCALHQETAAMIEERLADRVLLYTDGSVTADGSVAAACFAPFLGLHEKRRLPISASSTAAELAAIDLAENQLADFFPQSAPMVCDSRAALLTLARGERGAPHCAAARAAVRSDRAEWV